MTKQQPTNNPLPPSTNYHRFITPYGPKRKITKAFVGEGKTKQSFKDECDINKIMARFQQTGLIDFVNNHQARYLDCDGVDYQNAMLTVANANSMFQSLPSSVRAFFENNPALFVDFASDPENLPKMHEMGLTSPDYRPKPPTPSPAPANATAADLSNPQGSTATAAQSAPGT